MRYARSRLVARMLISPRPAATWTSPWRRTGTSAWVRARASRPHTRPESSWRCAPTGRTCRCRQNRGSVLRRQPSTSAPCSVPPASLPCPTATFRRRQPAATGQAPAPRATPDPGLHVAARPQRAKDASAESSSGCIRFRRSVRVAVRVNGKPRRHTTRSRVITIKSRKVKTRDHSLRRQRTRAVDASRRPPDETSRVDADPCAPARPGVRGLRSALSARLAHAGTYEVLTCGMSSGVNRSWVPFNGDRGQSARRGQLRHDPTAAPRTGCSRRIASLARRIRQRASEAGWRITAPTGTRITRLTLQYYLGQTQCRRVAPVHSNRRGQRPSKLRSARRTDELRTRGDALFSVRPGRLLRRRYRGLGCRRPLRGPERAVRHRRDAPSRVGCALRCSRPGDRHRVADDPGDERRTVARRISPRRGEPRDQCRQRQHRHSCDAAPGGRSSPHN